MTTVTLFDLDIPVWDYLTGHEWEHVELLLADMPASDMRANLLTLKIFVDSRTDHVLDVDAIMTGPVDVNALHEANEALLRPFANARRERAEKQLTTLPPHLQTSELKARKTLLTQALAAVERALSESGGGESKRSSTTTTQGSDSTGGKRNRLKKPSN